MNNFNYNSFFYPNYNLFNSNIDYRQIGIGGIKNPKFLVDILGNVNTTNLNITGNINYNHNIITNNLNFIQQNINSGLLIDKEINNNNNEWILQNNELQLILKNEELYKQLYYYSDIYKLNNSENTEIYIKTFLQIELLYIFIISNTINNTLTITINNTIYTLTNIQNTSIYKFDKQIILTNTSDTLNKFIFSNTSNSISSIQIIGKYISQGSSLWKLNKSDLYINHNVGIFTNNPISNLHVNRNMYISNNLIVNNNIYSDIINSNNVIVNNLNINNIQTIHNTLYINNNNNYTININSSPKKNDILNIYNNFIINHNSIQSNYLNIKKNININNSIKTKNFYIKFNNNNNNDKIIYGNKNNYLIIDNNKYVYIKNKLNILSTDNNNTNVLSVGGNMYIDNLYLYYNPFINQENFINSKSLTILSNNNNIISNINSNILNINKNIILSNLNTSLNYNDKYNLYPLYFDKDINEFIFRNNNINIKKVCTSNSDLSSINGFYNSLTIKDNFNINNQTIYMNANIEREELLINNNLKRFDISY